MDNTAPKSEEHPLSEKQTNTDDKKKETAIAALTDPDFPLPSIDEKTPTIRYVQSFAVLLSLLAGGMFVFWYSGATIFQTSHPEYVLTALFGILVLALFVTGTVWIDWWELVLGYWWLSIPIAAAAALVLVMNQEANTAIQETS